MHAHRVSYDRHGIGGIAGRFRPYRPDEFISGIRIESPRNEAIFQTMQDFGARFGGAGRNGPHLHLFADYSHLLALMTKIKAPEKERSSTRRRHRAKKAFGKTMEYVIGFLVSVAAGIITWRITRWLRDRGRDDDRGSTGNVKGARSSQRPRRKRISGREAFERTIRTPAEKGASGDIGVRIKSGAGTTKEVTFIKSHHSAQMHPRLRRALLEGYEEIDWGTLMKDIVDELFDGTYNQRRRKAETFLTEAFGLGLDDLLSLSPKRTAYFTKRKVPADGRLAGWIRSVRVFLGMGPHEDSLTALDVYRIMSRHTEGGIGLGSGDALQVALLWALKETGIALEDKPSHQLANEFIALAEKFHGGAFVLPTSASAIERLVMRIHYQLKSGCRFIHEHALIAFFARYLFERWDEVRLPTAVEEALQGDDLIETAKAIERCEIDDLMNDENNDETVFASSLIKIAAARFKYLAVLSGHHRPDISGRATLECAYINATDALQRSAHLDMQTKAYRSYIKDVLKDIGMALDVFRGNGNGGLHRGRNGVMPPMGDSGESANGDMSGDAANSSGMASSSAALPGPSHLAVAAGISGFAHLPHVPVQPLR